MKKTLWVFFLMTICSAFTFSVFSDDFADRIDLSREGGTTRGAGIDQTGEQGAGTIVEAINLQQVVTVSVQNYRGGVSIEIVGPRGVRQSYTEVYDSGSDVVDLSGLRAGQYTIRITLGSEVYTGKFKKDSYGR